MKYALSITLSGVLCGCAVGPNYQQPELITPLPAAYSQVSPPGTDTAISEEKWWFCFNDPAINQLVDAALQRNLDLANANANIRQARAQLNIVDSADQPQLNLDGRVGRDQFSRNSENFANIPFPHPVTTFSDYRIGFDASWEIDLFGRNQRSIEAAKARLTGIEHQRQDAELRVAAEVVRNVVDYRALQQRTQNAQQIVEYNRQLLDLIVLQQKAGLLADTDVIDGQTNLHNAKAALPPLQSAATASFMALTVLTNQTMDQVSAALGIDAAIPIASKQLNAIGLPSDLLKRRPDIQIAERQLAAATADVGVAVADQYPQITLLASGGLDSIKPGKLTNQASHYWDIGPQISLPILSGGRLAADVKAREAALDAALAQYRQTVLAAFADTESALIRYQREQQRLDQIQQALRQQQRQLAFSEQHYQNGDTNYVLVLQARLQLASINDAQLASQQALADNLALLYKSLGGGVSTTRAFGKS